jgi:hypothetical protein
MSTTTVGSKETTRLTVDLLDDDYQMLRVAAAMGGKGVTVSSIVRGLIHDYFELLQDEADYELVESRKGGRTLSGEEVRKRFAQRRRAAAS